MGEIEPGKPGSMAWPENWREEMFGSDPKVQEIAKRFGDPKAVANALLASQQRIRSGEYKRGQPKDATPEALAAWREEQGIPADPKEYGYILPEGVTVDQLDEGSKNRLDYFNETFHKANVPKAVVETITKAYNERLAAEAAQQATADAQLIDRTSDALIADWGPQFRSNLKMNAAYLDKELGADLTDDIMGARLADGRRLMDLPEMVKFINKIARNDGGDIIDPGVESGVGGGVDAQMAEIEKIMSTDFNRYRREGLDEKYRKLLDIKEKRGQLQNPNPQG